MSIINRSTIRAAIVISIMGAVVAARADGIGVFENIFGGIGNFGLGGHITPPSPPPAGCAGNIDYSSGCAFGLFGP